MLQSLTSQAIDSIDSILLNDWHVVARSQDLPPETIQTAQLLGVDLVLWRGKNTPVLAWEDRCPHRSVRLSGGKIAQDQLICRYHGLAFDSTGQCVHVPADPSYVPPKQACVRSFAVREQYGLIYVCLGTPTQDIPQFKEWADPSYRRCLCGPYPCQTSGLRAIENFLDVAHFPFVHPGSLGDIQQATIDPDYEVEITESGVWLKDIRVWQPDPDGRGQGAFVTYNYWALRPYTAYLQKTTDRGNLCILYHVTPVHEDECIGWMWVAMNDAPDVTEAEMLTFQDRLIQEDFANLELHNPRKLPLDPKAEFHLPFDKGSLMYRKWLKQLGVTYGTV